MRTSLVPHGILERNMLRFAHGFGAHQENQLLKNMYHDSRTKITLFTVLSKRKNTVLHGVFEIEWCYFFWLLMNANASRASETALTLRLICATLPSGATMIVSRL